MVRRTHHCRGTSRTCTVASLVVTSLTLAIAGSARRVGIATAQLSLSNLFPGALGMFLGAAHACREVLETVHMQSSAAIARWNDTLALCQALHPMHHFDLERAPIIFLWLLTGALA